MKKHLLFFILLFCARASYSQWETVYYPSSASSTLPQLYAVEFTDMDHGMAAGHDDNLYPIVIRTADHGNTWDTVFSINESFGLRSITFSDSTTAFAAGDGIGSNAGIIIRTLDYGMTWDTTLFSSKLFSISFPSPGTGYAVGADGFILKTTDNGITWNSQACPVSVALSDVCFLNDSLGIACGGSYILRTTNGGLHWDSIHVSTPVFYSGKISFPSMSRGYYFVNELSTGENHIYTTTDLGLTWTLQPGMPSFLTEGSLLFTNDSTGYIGGIFDISKTTDRGVTWTHQSSGPPSSGSFHDAVTDIFFLDEQHGFAVGLGQFYRTDNGGEIIPVSVPVIAGKDREVLVYPNPGKYNLQVKYPAGMGCGEFIIYSLTGNAVKRYPLTEDKGELSVDVSGLSAGMYLYAVRSNGKEEKKSKLIILR